MLKCIKRNPKKYLDKIKINGCFLESVPNTEKLIKKVSDYKDGIELNPIYIDKECYLVDGYCTYLIAKALGTYQGIKIVQIKSDKWLKGVKDNET